ncbi:MarR family winged helix-turn-helix transcriptional regulator [Corynebacterium sp. Q4381]|uniref:MarR family winged helix-turn-helix transcriptional regulator n=1 Tax=Corynebacterium sp. Marseille-Q4381 TaxID=3121597 RepID=UPI002FE62D86
MANEPQWLSEEEQRLWRGLIEAALKVSREIDEELRTDFDLTSAEYAVLVQLSEAEGQCMRLRDLCAQLNWDRSRGSHQVTRMERRGLVVKGSCANDARGVTVALTAEGLERLEDAVPNHVETVRRLIFAPTTSTDRAHVQKFVDAVLAVDNRMENDS